MTKITVDMAGFTIEASGHSGYAEHGSDIVCASISTIMQMVELFGGQCYSKHSGFMRVSIPANVKGAMNMMRSASFALHCLAIKYPENVQVTIVGGL